jgi:cytochrome oxidase Cu insertion factor (SCO1/SenC/PrrC family)
MQVPPERAGEPATTARSEPQAADQIVPPAAPPGIPRRVFYWGLAALVVLGGGGALLEHVLDDHGIPAYSVSASNTTIPTATSGSSTPGAIHAPLAQFMQIDRLSGAVAPQFHLVDQSGTPVSLAGLRGRVVVLTFFSEACNDICPVIGREIALADRDLGARAAGVAFVAVNADPLVTAPTTAQRTSAALGLASEPNWYLLTGSLAQLDPVWTRYGVTIDVAKSTGRVAVTPVLYFLDGAGHERLRATPFADETRAGKVSLPRSSLDRFAAGIASYARSLISH